MFQPKDPAARKFVRQFDKFTIILCGTAAIAYGIQQYYVSAPRIPISRALAHQTLRRAETGQHTGGDTEGGRRSKG